MTLKNQSALFSTDSESIRKKTCSAQHNFCKSGHDLFLLSLTDSECDEASSEVQRARIPPLVACLRCDEKHDSHGETGEKTTTLRAVDAHPLRRLAHSDSELHILLACRPLLILDTCAQMAGAPNRARETSVVKKKKLEESLL